MLWRLADESAIPSGLQLDESEVVLVRVDAGLVLLWISEAELAYVPADPGWSCD